MNISYVIRKIIKPLVRHTDPGEAEGHQEGLLRSEVLQPVGPARTPSAGNIGIVELRMKAARSLIRHDQLAVFRGADPAMQLPVRYRAVVVVLLAAAYQPVSVRHLRRNDRQGLHVTVRQDLRVFARHYSPLCAMYGDLDPFATFANSNRDSSSKSFGRSKGWYSNGQSVTRRKKFRR